MQDGGVLDSNRVGRVDSSVFKSKVIETVSKFHQWRQAIDRCHGVSTAKFEATIAKRHSTAVVTSTRTAMVPSNHGGVSLKPSRRHTQLPLSLQLLLRNE